MSDRKPSEDFEAILDPVHSIAKCQKCYRHKQQIRLFVEGTRCSIFELMKRLADSRHGLCGMNVAAHYSRLTTIDRDIMSRCLPCVESQQSQVDVEDLV